MDGDILEKHIILQLEGIWLFIFYAYNNSSMFYILDLEFFIFNS